MAGPSARPLPSRAEVVIIGGGVIGTSIAFHLAEAGVTDVVLLERAELGSGSTSKAAGGVRAQFSDRLNIELGARSLEAFAQFGRRPGQEVDLRRVGYLFLLSTAADVAAFTRDVRLQNELGVASRMIDAAEAGRRCPLIDTDGVLAAAFSPDDGHCTPESVVLGYATGARRLGATLLTGIAVTGIETAHGEARAVLTDRGRVEAGSVVCAAGAWSREIGAMVGLELPVTPVRRQVMLTEPMPGLDPALPFTIDFATSFYFHEEGPGLLVGMSDPDEEFGFRLGTDDRWLGRLSEAVAHRAPRVAEAGVAHGWAGLYEITPDHNALVGNVGRFFYATGFSGHGFLQSPAIGEVMRDLVLGRTPPIDVSGLDVRRFDGAEVRPEHNCV
jgi:sarcosine oxidase, subunit beta